MKRNPVIFLADPWRFEATKIVRRSYSNYVACLYTHTTTGTGRVFKKTSNRRSIQCHIPSEVFIRISYSPILPSRDTKPPYNCARSRRGEYKRTSLTRIPLDHLGYKRWFSRSTHTDTTDSSSSLYRWVTRGAGGGGGGKNLLLHSTAGWIIALCRRSSIPGIEIYSLHAIFKITYGDPREPRRSRSWKFKVKRRKDRERGESTPQHRYHFATIGMLLIL